jgi:uncharacterized protein with GYD domain
VGRRHSQVPEKSRVGTNAAPDDTVAARFTPLRGKHGNVRTTSMKAFPEGAFRRIIASLP